MAKRAYFIGSLDGSAPIYKEVPVNASQTIVHGSIVVKATNKASVAAAAAAAGTVWGVAVGNITTGASVTAADVVKIDVNPMSVYSLMLNTTGTKTTVTKSDVGTLYDLGANAWTANLDDTTGGYLELVDTQTYPGRAKFLIKNRVQVV
jgi:hypothetical protein